MASNSIIAKNVWFWSPQKCTKCHKTPSDLIDWALEDWEDNMVVVNVKNQVIKVKCPQCCTKKAGTFFICLRHEKITNQQACRLCCGCGSGRRSSGNREDQNSNDVDIEATSHLSCGEQENMDTDSDVGQHPQVLNPFEAPFISRSFFNKENNWPENSSRFFIDDHDNSVGVKGLVYRAVYNKSMTCFNDMSDLEMHFHLLNTRIFKGQSCTESKNLCALINHLRTTFMAASKKDRGLMKIWDLAQHNALIQTFDKLGLDDDKKQRGHQIFNQHFDWFKTQFTSCHDGEAEDKIVRYYDFVDVDRVYRSGWKSIAKTIPMPEVSIVHTNKGTREETEYAHIEAEQILNHLLALGFDCYFIRAGYEEDWSLERFMRHADFADLNKQTRRTRRNRLARFFFQTKEKVEAMLQSNPLIPKDTRIVILRMWSDSFEAHKIKTNTEMNSLQVYTLKLYGPKNETLPLAFTFKKFNTSAILVELLTELQALREVKMRYWKSEKSAIPTVAFLELISNDYPERCFNCSIGEGGLYSKRFGYSCLYDPQKTCSCASCDYDRVQMLVKRKDMDLKTSCGECEDWYSDPVDRRSVHPVQPGEDLSNVKICKLSFELLKNSLKALEKWYKESINEGKKASTLKTVVFKYMQILCLSGTSNNGVQQGLYEALVNGTPFEKCSWYPELLKRFEDLDVELDAFPSMPMHLLFLGIEKALIKVTHKIKLNGSNEVKVFWKEFMKIIKDSQKSLNSTALNWCSTMTFSKSSKDDIGAANWQSDHCLAFTRVSLFQFGALDGAIDGLTVPKSLEDVIKSFKRMRVTWFCLIAHLFTKEPVPEARIENMIRLFLTSCVDFSEKAQFPKSKPFFHNKPNFFTLLNLPEIIRLYGPLYEIWEGLDEAFIQQLKREIIRMRYNTGYLKTILEKQLYNKMFTWLDSTNPFTKHVNYARISEANIYRQGKSYANVDDVLFNEDFVSGVVINGEFYICFEESKTNVIKLYPLMFDDFTGKWCMDLWYTNVQVMSEDHELFTDGIDSFDTCKDRKELNEISEDFFMMLRHKDAKDTFFELRTIILRSWKVRREGGNIELPLPLEDTLLYGL